MPFVSGTGSTTGFLGTITLGGPVGTPAWPIVRSGGAPGLGVSNLSSTTPPPYEWGAGSGTDGAGTGGTWDVLTTTTTNHDSGAPSFDWQPGWSDGTDLYILHTAVTTNGVTGKSRWELRVIRHADGAAPAVVAGPFTTADFFGGAPDGPHWLARRGDGSFVAFVVCNAPLSGGGNVIRPHLVVWNVAGTAATEYDPWTGTAASGADGGTGAGDGRNCFLAVQPGSDLIHMAWSGAKTFHRTLDTGGTWGAWDSTNGVSANTGVGSGVCCVRGGSPVLALSVREGTTGVRVLYLAADTTSTAAVASEVVTFPAALSAVRDILPLAVTEPTRDAGRLLLLGILNATSTVYGARRDPSTGWPAPALFKTGVRTTAGTLQSLWIPAAQNVGVRWVPSGGGTRFDYWSTTPLFTARLYAWGTVIG